MKVLEQIVLPSVRQHGLSCRSSLPQNCLPHCRIATFTLERGLKSDKERYARAHYLQGSGLIVRKAGRQSRQGPWFCQVLVTYTKSRGCETKYIIRHIILFGKVSFSSFYFYYYDYYCIFQLNQNCIVGYFYQLISSKCFSLYLAKFKYFH